MITISITGITLTIILLFNNDSGHAGCVSPRKIAIDTQTCRDPLGVLH